MICPKCGSNSVNVQAVSNVHTKRKGILWWLFIGWWWVPIKWFCFFWLALLAKIFGSKKIKTDIEAYAVCQNCGYKWRT